MAAPAVAAVAAGARATGPLALPAGGVNLPANVARATGSGGSVGNVVRVAMGAGGSGRSLSDVGSGFFTILQGLELASKVDSNFPSFTHVIMVSVYGGPKSNLLRIWQLALSTAFGRYRQAGLMGIQEATLEGSWDITNKSVMVRLSYVNSGIIETLQSTLYTPTDSGFRSNTTSNFLLNGPTSETVGGNRVSWVESDGVIAAAVWPASEGAQRLIVGGSKLISGSISGQLGDRSAESKIADGMNDIKQGLGAAGPAEMLQKMSTYAAIQRLKYPLPDTGRLITTGVKNDPDVQPPAPSLDGYSRTSPFLALVANSLTDPCYLPASPPQVKPRKRKGRRFPGNVLEKRLQLNGKVNGYVSNVPLKSITTPDEGKVVLAADMYPQAVPPPIVDLSGMTATGVS